MSDFDNYPRQQGDAQFGRKPLWPRMILLIAFIVVALALVAKCAHAQDRPPDDPTLGDCVPYAKAVDTLKRLYGETGTGQALVDQTKTAVEVFIGPAHTLTVVEVFPDQTTCYRAFNSGAVQNGLGWGAQPNPAGEPM